MPRKGIRTHNRKHSDIQFESVHRVVGFWLRGMSYQEVAEAMFGRHDLRLSAEDVREIVRLCVRELWSARYKWRLAEARCYAMAQQIRLLRLGREAEPDQPIEILDPPLRWLKAFHLAGVHTVHHLRAVPTAILLSQRLFPKGAVDWAVMKLDKLGMSHVLTRPKINKQGLWRRKNPGGRAEPIR